MCASAKGAPVHLVVTGVWVSALLAQAQQQLRRFNPQDISMLLWAVAELSTLPSAGASAQLQHQQASARSQGATGASKGAAGKSRPPSDASESDPPLDGTLVNLPPGFLPAVLEASQATLHQAGPQALSNTLWALATLRSPPPPQWLSAFMKHSTQQLRDAAPQALANIGWALATMGVSERTTPEWRRAYLEASAAAAAYAPPISLAQSTWAVARLRLKPGAEWVEGVQNASASRLASFASQDLSNLIWGLASVGARPNIAWMDAFLRSVRSQLRSFNAGELGSIMWALATLRFHPGEATLRPMLAAFAERMPSAGAPALMCVLWACARLRVVPDPLWMEVGACAWGCACLLFLLFEHGDLPPCGALSTLLDGQAVHLMLSCQPGLCQDACWQAAISSQATTRTLCLPRVGHIAFLLHLTSITLACVTLSSPIHNSNCDCD